MLAKEEDRVLVISRYGLDAQPYNTEYTDVTWESSTLRMWLNGTFLQEAFTSEEVSLIMTGTVTADKNPDYSTDPGNDTRDQVFLLSITEAEKYFTDDEARKCVPTAYAVAQGAYTSSSETAGGAATCWWWLRSPGSLSYYAACVHSGVSVNRRGNSVDDGDDVVRPALWITLES